MPGVRAMKPADLIKPILADAPCGDNLLDADDPDFVEYYFGIEDRLPTTYFDLRSQTLFDPKTIDAKAESAQIDALLKRSRDLRLLGADAKFQILAGRFKGFVNAVMGIAALVETFPDDVHPKSNQERQNAIEELNSIVTIAAPLDYAVLFSDRRVGDVIYRNFATGAGKIAPRTGETKGDASKVTDALGSSENAKLVDELYADLTGTQGALATITARSNERGFYPKLNQLEAKLGEIVEMVVSARPDLAAAAAAAAVVDEIEQVTPENVEAPVSTGGPITISVPTINADVPDHRAVFRLLTSVQSYFVAHEPTSLALILVVQSRQLIGRPLVEALDILMEAASAKASITFGGDVAFTISMARMRELTANAPTPSSEDLASTAFAPGPEGEAAEAPVILSREHAGMVLKQVEDFYRAQEPSSPIPILLFKARNMLTKDFHALVNDLMPGKP